MNERLLQLLLLTLAAVQLLPLSGWRGAGALQKLYGIELSPQVQADLLHLLRHRALLLALPGLLLLWSIVQAPLRIAALTLTALSMAGFLWLALRGRPNAALRRVAWVDAFGVLLLALATLLL